MSEYSEITEMDDIQSIKSCGGATLIWRNVNVYIKEKKNGRGKKNLKRIINNSTGFIQPGTLMAVMGSRCVCMCSFVEMRLNFRNVMNSIDFYSGAGKSTLMSALAYRNMGNRTTYLLRATFYSGNIR